MSVLQNKNILDISASPTSVSNFANLELSVLSE